MAKEKEAKKDEPKETAKVAAPVAAPVVEAAAAAVPSIEVFSPQARGFRRFGRTFTRKPQLIPLSDLTQDQVSTLLNCNKKILDAKLVNVK